MNLGSEAQAKSITMSLSHQAIFLQKIAKLRNEGRFLSAAERAGARHAAKNLLAPTSEEELAPLLASLDDAIPYDQDGHPILRPVIDDLNDELDRLLADLPVDFDNVPPVPVVTNLDGSPSDDPSGPTLQALMGAARVARATRGAEFAYPAAANDDGCEIGPDLTIPECTRPVARNPQKRLVRPRTSYRRDLRNLPRLERISGAPRPTRAASADRPSVAEPYPSSTPLQTHETTTTRTRKKGTSKSTKKRRKADENDQRRPPAWGRTTDIAKGHCYIRTVSTRGAGLSWTLNFGGKMLQAANDNPAGIKEKLHDRLDKALRAIMGGSRDFVFGIEQTKSGRWHAHGAIDGAEDERQGIEQALRRAGGTWGSGHHEDRQAHTDVLWGPDGWTRYLLKNMATTKRRLGIKSVLSVTRGCRQRAEDLWNISRLQA